MKTTFKLFTTLFFSIFLFVQCDMDDEEMPIETGMFQVTIENVSAEKMFFASGVFNTPVGATEPGGGGPRQFIRIYI